MGLEVCLIRDAGRTQIAPGSKTVLGVGPGNFVLNFLFCYYCPTQLKPPHVQILVSHQNIHTE